ncbi:MAG TPA: LuxR C-terminal-related transcriptional regulator [Jatrophihabitans sp.]|jgi:LuxR family maltose regulon positive regulatory protein
MQVLSSRSGQALQPRDEPGATGVAAGPRAVDDVVIATKLFVPTPSVEPVLRPRLQAQLQDAATRLLTLVVAPAGWGKSTLIADWLHHRHVGTGWVSLDQSDNDITRFARYLLLATQKADSRTGTAALQRLDNVSVNVGRDVLPLFVNELAAAPDDVTVVVDDYHVISSRSIHELVADLLEHAPPQLHLVISSRTDPSLPLSKLRVRGDLAELRADQLRFTATEAAELLNGAAGASLSRHEVERLVARTEGWAAGLQLAALRLADRAAGADRDAFIEQFTGADRHVVDYLGEEVLASQPVHIREFLLRTSILNRLSAELCDAVTERHDGTGALDDIYRANLFLIPLDDEQRWFRYHQLFREILRHELARLHPTEPDVLHRRAAAWFAAAGDVGEAIGHAMRSRDLDLCTALVADGWRREFNAGHLQTVQAWLDALPRESVASNVQLTMAQVWLALDAGRLDEAAASIEAAERTAADDPHVRVLRALHTYKIGDIRRAADMVRATGGTVADPFLATVRDLLAGVCNLWLGDLTRAGDELRAAAVTALRNVNRLAHVYAGGCLALVATQAGDLAGAHTVLDEMDTRTVDAHFVAMFPALAHARLAATRGDWDDARTAADMAVDRARPGGGKVEVAAALVTAAWAERGGGDIDSASRRLGEARSVLRECADPGPVLTEWVAREKRAWQALDGASGVERLTDRERAILALLPGAQSQRELAGALFVTPNTLKTHLRAIYRKLGVASRTEAVTRARAIGLL